ncbi:unnamed protein product [Chrysoparadoxa australica]
MEEEEAQCRTLWIGDVTEDWEEESLHQFFASHLGITVKAKLMRNQSTGASLGYGFLHFDSHENARQALENLNGKVIPETPYSWRLNWGAGGKRVEEPTENSLYVGNLPPHVDGSMLKAELARVCPGVLGAKIVRSPVDGLSRGYGFVRLESSQDREYALKNLRRLVIGGNTVRLARGTKRNTPKGISPDCGNCTVFIGGITEKTSDHLVLEALEPYGKVESIKFKRESACGFVTFEDHQSASNAIEQLDGLTINEQTLRLSWGKAKQGALETPAMSMHNQHHNPGLMRTTLQHSVSFPPMGQMLQQFPPYSSMPIPGVEGPSHPLPGYYPTPLIGHLNARRTAVSPVLSATSEMSYGFSPQTHCCYYPTLGDFQVYDLGDSFVAPSLLPPLVPQLQPAIAMPMYQHPMQMMPQPLHQHQMMAGPEEITAATQPRSRRHTDPEPALGSKGQEPEELELPNED